MNGSNLMINKKKSLPKTLSLDKITLYAVNASIDEFKNADIGYYKESHTANIKAKKAGWYGSDGTVETRELFTDGEFLYEVKKLGKYTDLEEKEHKEMVKNLKGKLSKDEIRFLQENEDDFKEK
jgi:hypothetical protein